MIVVSGAKRSGTSMWMQILNAGGFQLLGEAFPRNWEQTIKTANPHGFFESELLMGINFLSNPHPTTGQYLFPEQTRTVAVKIFAPGLGRSEIAFLDRVVVTMRPWAEYVASLLRLRQIAREANGIHDSRKQDDGLPPALEWWSDYYETIRDVATRRYPVHFQSYAGLLADPPKVLRHVFDWIGAGDPLAATAAVDPSLYRNRVTTPPQIDLPPGCVEVFDELYDTIHRGNALDDSFVGKLNETHQRLTPLLLDHYAAAGERATHI